MLHTRTLTHTHARHEAGSQRWRTPCVCVQREADTLKRKLRHGIAWRDGDTCGFPSYRHRDSAGCCRKRRRFTPTGCFPQKQHLRHHPGERLRVCVDQWAGVCMKQAELGTPSSQRDRTSLKNRLGTSDRQVFGVLDWVRGRWLVGG